jgi:hypothetical protein
MKKTEEPGIFAYGVVYIMYSLLLAWWGTWILPHFTEQVFGYWQLAGFLLLAYLFALPKEIIWLPYFLCATSTIYIWLFL